MLVIAIAGIRLTARTQIALAAIEYAILAGLAIAGLVFVAGHHPGTVPVGLAWLSPAGIGGQGSLAAGFLISAFVIAGWDGTLYINEEVRHRRVNPGRAAMWAAGLLAVLYMLPRVDLQGVVSPAKLQANYLRAIARLEARCERSAPPSVCNGRLSSMTTARSRALSCAGSVSSSLATAEAARVPASCSAPASNVTGSSWLVTVMSANPASPSSACRSAASGSPHGPPR